MPHHKQCSSALAQRRVSTLRRSCLQAFNQLRANGKVKAEDMIVMVECHLRASKHQSALQMLQHRTVSLSAAAVMLPHKQRELFHIVLRSRSLQTCSPELLLKLLAVGLQQQTADAKQQLLELITACVQHQDMQLAKQVRCLQHL